MSDEVNLNIRVPAWMRDQFKDICETRDRTMSQELRAFIRKQCEENSQTRMKV